MNDPVLRGFLRGREARRKVEEIKRYVLAEWDFYIKSSRNTNENISEVSFERSSSPIPLYLATLHCEM